MVSFFFAILSDKTEVDANLADKKCHFHYNFALVCFCVRCYPPALQGVKIFYPLRLNQNQKYIYLIIIIIICFIEIMIFVLLIITGDFCDNRMKKRMFSLLC